MAGAGLTVGAFYAHFGGKDELLEESFTLALEENGDVMREGVAGRAGRSALRDVAAYYLSEEHRDRPKQGCPMPAVAASAIPLGGRPLHRLVARGLETLAERISKVGAGDITSDRALALAVLMIGGQIIARATRGSPVSSRVLVACRSAAERLIQTDRV